MTKTRSLLAVLCIATGLLGLGIATRASAADTGGYPYANAKCSVTGQVNGSCSNSTWTINGNSADPWGYIYRNCTSYVAWKLSQGGYTMPRGASHASNWDNFFRSRGVPVNSTPAVGAIAQTDAGNYGHVAYVEAVGNGTVTVSEYNVPFPLGAYHTRTITTNSFVYIHVHDQPPPTTTVPPRRPDDASVKVRADFNGDGNDDVLVVGPRGPSGLNFVPLLSNGTSGFVHGGLWFNTGTDYTLDVVRLVAGDFNGDGRSDMLVVTPRGPSGLNFVPLLSTGTAFSHSGLWFNTGTDYAFDQIKLASGDFNGDGKDDVLLVSPRGPSGLNFVPLLSNGTTAFVHGGLWFNTGTDYTLDVVRLVAGDFNGDNKSDVLVVTPRGPSGVNFVPLLSNGATAFSHGGLWFNTGTDYTLDWIKLAAGDFNGDGRSDVLVVTPRGPSGLNFVPLLSNGTSAFVHGGLWFNTGTELTLDVLKLAAGDFNADGNDDLVLVTPRGPSGLNFVPLLSDGTSTFSHGGLWFNTGTDYNFDQIKLA